MREINKKRINNLIDSMKDDMIRSVQELVRIRSVKDKPQPGAPFGEGPAMALAKALEIAESLGFKTVNIDNYVGYAEYGEGKEMIAILGHLDVVPEGTGWNYPPYAAEIHDGKIYGRGTTDDKGPIVAALYGLKALKESGLSPLHRIRVIFGTDEESGSGDIKYYLEHGGEVPIAGFTPDAMYPVIRSEKGIIIFDAVKEFKRKPSNIVVKYIHGGVAPNSVPDYCEGTLAVEDDGLRKSIVKKFNDFVKEKKYQMELEEKSNILVFRSKGIAAHAMEPEKGKNAIMQLITFLDTIGLDNSDVASYIHFFAKNIGMETDGNSIGIKCMDDTGELTLNVGVIDLNEDKGLVSVNPRYPCTFKGADIMEKIEEKARTAGIEIKILMDQPPLYFPIDHPLIKILMKVFEEQTNQKGLRPLSIGGGTYAKAMPNIVGFGPLFPGEPVVEHRPNEYFKIEDLILNSKIYAHAIYELDKNIKGT
jgi:succinyl-diaminopimelate desuccinylase